MQSHDPHQTSQRLRVGLIGLVVVVLLIGLAGRIIGGSARLPAADNALAEIAANLADNADAGEPLAELGAAPGVPDNQIVVR